MAKVMTDSNKVNLIFLIPPIILIAAAISFFGSGGHHVLATEPASFWVWVAIGFIVAVVCAFVAKNLNEHGSDRLAILVVVFGVVMLVAPWGKAATDKADPIGKQRVEIKK
jgi:undecaprenyl pyrophosphate phosphatase UppP